MCKNIITVKNLVKKYNNKFIFNNVNLEIKKGESIALIGNNGIGKSTLIKMICGLTRIDSGEILYDKNLKFNYIPEKFPALNLTPLEYIKLISSTEGINNEEFQEKSNYLFEKFNFTNMINTSMKYLSKGSLQKVAVIQALISKPDVLLLDEPLSGQDIDSQKTFIEMIQNLINDKVTVIMSCHELFLINEISSKILKVKDFNLVEVSKENLQNEQYSFIEVYKKKKEDSKLIEIKKVYNCMENIDTIKIKVDKDQSNELLRGLLESKYVIKRFEL